MTGSGADSSDRWMFASYRDPPEVLIPIRSDAPIGRVATALRNKVLIRKSIVLNVAEGLVMNRFVLAAISLVLGFRLEIAAAPAATEKVIHAFCSQKNCPDGMYPLGSLTEDKKGVLYGTTSSGGAFGGGTAYKLKPDGTET